MLIRKTYLIVLGVLLAAASAFAATYYVDPAAGSDSNNGTSQTSAWQHMPGTLSAVPSSEGSATFISAPGWVTLAAGDTIIVKGGSVSSVSVQIDATWYNSGSAGNLITIISGDRKGWGTGRAVIDGGSNTSGTGTWSRGFDIYGPSYIHIEGFEIRNMANMPQSAGVYIDGNSVSHDEVVGNYIHDIYGAPGDQGYGIEITGGNAQGYFLVEYNTIIRVEKKAIELYYQGYSTIAYNYISQTADHGVVISSSYNTIYRNLITQSGNGWLSYTSPFRPAYGLKFDGNMPTLPADHNVMYDNLIWNCSSGIGILNASYNQIYFNTVYYSGFQGGESGGEEGSSFALADDDGTGDAGDYNTVKDNIFYYNNILNGSGQTVASVPRWGATTRSPTT